MNRQHTKRSSGHTRKARAARRPPRAASRETGKDLRIKALEARVAELEAGQASGGDFAARERGERTLREGEEPLWLSHGSREIGAWEWTPRTGAFSRTPELDRLFGMTPDAVRTYQEWLQRTHAEDMAGVGAARDGAVAGRTPFDVEFRILDSTEQVRWIHDRGSAICDEAGEVARVLGVSVDITERKQAEELSRALCWIDDITCLAPETVDVVQGTLTVAAKAVGCDTAMVALRQDGRWVVSRVYGFQPDLIGFPMTDEDEPHLVLAAGTKQPVRIDDSFNDPRVSRQHMTKLGIRSVLVVPLVAGGEAVGVIVFNSHQLAFAFDDVHVAFGARLATTLALVLEKSRLVRDLREAAAGRANAERDLAGALARLRAFVKDPA